MRHAELMVFFLEQGNAFTVEYGDIDAGFYDALLVMASGRAGGTKCAQFAHKTTRSCPIRVGQLQS